MYAFGERGHVREKGRSRLNDNLATPAGLREGGVKIIFEGTLQSNQAGSLTRVQVFDEFELFPFLLAFLQERENTNSQLLKLHCPLNHKFEV